MPYVPPSRRSQGHLCTAATTTADVVPHTAGGSLNSPPGHKKRWKRSYTWPPPSIPLVTENPCPGRPTAICSDASGQTVQSILRPQSSRRRQSTDAQLIRPRSVHFDPQVDVRHFICGDEPRAVSTRSSSPTGSSHEEDVDNEEPSLEPVISTDGRRDCAVDIVTTFPASTVSRRGQPVRLERVWLVPSADDSHGPSLRGSVAVANLACHKSVTCRFTLDSWTTQSDVAAVYESAIPLTDCRQPYDRFLFTIPISDFTGLEQKTLVLCLRYQVLDLDCWDNNNGNNFEIKFRRRRPRCQHVGQEERGRRPDRWTTANHKLPAAAAIRDEQQLASLKLADSTDEEHGLKSTDRVVQQRAPADGLTPLAAAALLDLSSRYDFDISLAAAIKAAKTPSREKRKPLTDGLLSTIHLPMVQQADGLHC